MAVSVVLSVVACTGPQASPGEASSDKKGDAMSAPDSFARVVAQVGAGAQVMRAEGGGEGVELFRVLRAPAGATAPVRGEGAAVVGGRVLMGVDAMRAVGERVGEDADALATAALVLLEPRAGDVVGKAKVVGDVVEFDWRTGDGPGRALMRGRLTRGSWAWVSSPAAAEGDAVADAIAALEGGGDIARLGAVALLAERCDDARVGPALVGVITGGGSAEVRARAAELAGGCASVGVEVLAGVLRGDGEAVVRMGAAAGLGVRGGAESEAALRGAIGGEADAGVKQAIGRAVKRIMGGK